MSFFCSEPSNDSKLYLSKNQCAFNGLWALNDLAPSYSLPLWPQLLLLSPWITHFPTTAFSLLSSHKSDVVPLLGDCSIWPLYLEPSSHNNCMVHSSSSVGICSNISLLRDLPWLLYLKLQHPHCLHPLYCFSR